MLAYCTALGVPEGHFVYASEDAPSSHTGTKLHTWVLDLSQHTEHILKQVGSIANAVAATIIGMIEVAGTRWDRHAAEVRAYEPLGCTMSG